MKFDRCRNFDTPCLFAGDIGELKLVATAWYGDKLNKSLGNVKLPYLRSKMIG
jgi:hypothetical protein